MISIPSVILGLLVFCIMAVAAVYYLSLRPARIIEQWAAGLSNGGHFPKKPIVNGLYWLLPVHREMQAVSDKIEGLKRQVEEAKLSHSEEEFLNHCVLASLLEGVLVMDAHSIITLANAEFIHMFQLNQSPMQRPMSEVIRDTKMQDMIVEALATSRVQSGRFTRPAATVEVGRPQTIEVSAVPLRLQKSKVGGVIVIFLPPPDRLRIVQDMKRHSQRLHNLVSEIAYTRIDGREASPLNKRPVEISELLNWVLAGFAAKAEDNNIKIPRHFEDHSVILQADAEQVKLAMLHLLDNLSFDMDSVSEIALDVRQEEGSIAIQTTFIGGSISETQLRRSLAQPLDPNIPGLPVIGGASLGLVRAVMERHGGQVKAVITEEKQLHVTLYFPDHFPQNSREIPTLKSNSELA